jgi:CheY-like chemotaxis protein/two-component sensor histidine kinase
MARDRTPKRDISKRKRSERLENEFVATVSHELRTPLTSIAGSLGLLIGGAAGDLPSSAERLLKIAYNNSQRLVRLINDILDIEKIESGHATFDLKPVDLWSLIEQAIESNRGVAGNFGVRMRLEPHVTAAIVRADADRIIQVVTNLISNAIKFSPTDAEVVIAIEDRGAAVRVSVRDRGPGIPEAFRTRVFEKFAQADPAGAGHKGGTGLGLNIVKQIIDHHGGIVGFEPATGHGTIFYFELSRAADVRLDGAEAFPIAFRPQAGGRPRILHVDDDRDVLHVVAQTLCADAEVISACSIKEARHVLADGDVDLAVIDLGLADGVGLDLLAALRNAKGGAIPVVVFSAQDASPDVARRVDAVLTKSRASLDRLLAILRRLASQGRAPRAASKDDGSIVQLPSRQVA